MIKNGEIVVVKNNGPYIWKMLIVNKDEYINGKGEVEGRLLDIVAGGHGNIKDYLIELDQQEYIYVTEAGGNYLMDVN